jgi:hypothetical protein
MSDEHEHLAGLIPVPLRLDHLLAILQGYEQAWPQARVGAPETYGVTRRWGPDAGHTYLLTAMPVFVDRTGELEETG